jgi:hypothetical protein
MQWVGGRDLPWQLVAIPLITLLLALGVLTAKGSAGQVIGGPVAVLGIDAEDSSGGGHGPIATYVSLTNSILGNVMNGGNGILVIGGGKFPGDPDDVTAFWNAIGAAIPSQPITYVNNETVPGSIAGQSFAGFALIVVSSSINETPNGGLTTAENTALVARADEIADFVDAGGGVLGFTQSGFSPPYAYLNGISTITATTGLEFQDITATAEGIEVGITDALDICCWHDELTTFPSFLMPLATNALTGRVVAVGGSQITFDTTTTSLSTSTSIGPTTSSSTPATTTTSTTRAPATTMTTRPATTSTTAPGRTAATSTTVPRTRTTGTMPLSN